ncbi:riboflavin biosynthesis protein [Metamycoplasma phocicerebrale]|uniref:FAD synthase n=1 Tax=Metamycoplasma phocicerebrale TaxID=142649 RepID=A0A3T0TU58_9BACT|nr:riboflavin biosynthesis protein [Metamycoplasma phocicerebrale]AZZ65553.1 riboflavin biosynthesis protein [Metamycoplasma phocicerebrale]
MKVFEWNFKEKFEIKEKVIMILGSFETLHLGHYELIKAAKDKKNSNPEYKIAISVFNEPYKNNKNNLKKAFQVKTRIYTLFNLEIDYVFIAQINKENLNISHIQFINNLKENNISVVVCGQDYKFGFRRLGDLNYLKKHFELIVINERKIHKRKISSTLINELIEEGNISAINNLLIEKYAFITNLENFQYVYPAKLNKLKYGIYIVNVVIDNIEYHGLTKIGNNNDINNDNELYLFDLNVIPSKYQEILIEFESLIRYIRSKHENNILENDIEIAKSWFISK